MSCRLLFGGDIAPVRSDPSGMFGDLEPLIGEADLALANLEIALSDAATPFRGKIYPHKGTPVSAEGLARAGFDAVNLANNHMLDFGEQALFDTMALLDQVGVCRFGAGSDLAEAERPLVLERGGLSIGVIGLTTTLPTGFAAGEGVAGVNPLRVLTSYRQFRNPDEYPGTAPIVETAPVGEDLDRLTGAVRALKGWTDIVLVYAHWGTSMSEAVQDFQHAIGRAAIDAGADAVFGGHQHVVSGVEFHRGRPIVHGLGNLVFDFVVPFFTEATRRTVVFTATLTASGVEDCRLIPCRTGVGSPVAVLDPEDGDGLTIAETVRRLSAPLGTEVGVESGRIVVRPGAG